MPLRPGILPMMPSWRSPAGACSTLSRDELQGVIGHEFSHILNGDMRLNLRLMGVLFGILLIGLTGYILLRSTSGYRVR